MVLGLALGGVGAALMVLRRRVLPPSRAVGLGLAVVVAAALWHLPVAPGLELDAGRAGAYGGLLGGAASSGPAPRVR